MLYIRQKSFVGRALPGPAGEAYSAPPDLLAGSWGKGGKRKGEMEGQNGWEGGGRGREKEGRGMKGGRGWEEGISPYE